MPVVAATGDSDRCHEHLRRHGRDPEAEDDTAPIDAFLQKPAGLSTLDFLRRRLSSAAGADATSGNIKGVSLSSLPKDVRREMSALASAELRKQQRLAKNAERAIGLDFSRLGLRSDEEEERALIGRLLGTPPTAPITRKLVGGRLIRESELAKVDDSKPSNLSLSLDACRSAPTLWRSVATMSSSSSLASESVKQSEAETQTRRRRCRHEQQPATKDSSTDTDERSTLRRREELLQKELLRVTQKLCRKYSRRLAPVDRGSSVTRSKTQELAEQWTSIQSHQQHRGEGGGEKDVELDRRRHAAFAAGRFSTQSALDYYAREIELREPRNDPARRILA